MKTKICTFFACLGFVSVVFCIEPPLTQSQREEYARIYSASVPPRGTGASEKEFHALLEMQEQRMALPDTKNFRTFLQTRSAIKLLQQGQAPELGYLLSWNEVSLLATSLDHYNATPGVPNPAFAEQFGPTRASRALAIVHLAMFEAVNTVTRKYQSYKGLQSQIASKLGVPLGQMNPQSVSINAAIVEAGHRTLIELYPNKRHLFDTTKDLHVPQLGEGPHVTLGIALGKVAAELVLKERMNDGSELPDLSASDFESDNPETWHQDPISRLGPALGGNWHRVRPFVLSSASVHRPKAPPAYGSPEFTQAYKEVKRLGGDPNAPTLDPRWPTQTQRTGAAAPDNPVPADNTNETFVGIYWGYDGTALLCAPPRLYNTIATSVALREKPISHVDEMARYLALINLSMADAGVAAWEAKFHYLYPRPITYLRARSADGSPEGEVDPRWTPLGAPVTNGTAAGRNLSPPFPAYPSGHATFGGALFKTMSLYFGLPEEGIPFKFVSDEYNGLNRGPGSDTPRQRVEANFTSFKEAELLNARSRIFLGIHWAFDATEGIVQGNEIAKDVVEGVLKPAE